MSIYATVNERYLQAGIIGLTPQLSWDQVAMRDSAGQPITIGNETASVNHIIYEVPDAHTSALPASGDASVNITPTADVISVSLDEYGEGYITVPASETLEGVEPSMALLKHIEQQAENAGKSLNALAKTAGIDTIPASGSYTNGTMTYSDVQADGLVYLGTDTTSESARNTIATTDIIDVSWVDRAHTKLRTRGAKPFAMVDGQPVYAAVIHPNVWFDIQQDDSFNGLNNMIQYTASANDAILFNYVGVWRGFIWITDNNNIYSGAGAGAINVYPTVFLGKDFLVKDYASPAMLPKSEGGKLVETMDIMESAQIRLVPQLGTHAREKILSWYAYVGYGVYNASAAFRLETASSLG